MLMNTLSTLFNWLNDSQLAILISENDYLFPWIESVHVLAITIFFGSLALVDFRLMGLAFLEKTFHRFSEAILPLTWIAFGFALITGALLFISKAITYSHNNFFLAKMCLLICAGINMIIFQKWTGRNMADWGINDRTPLAAKLAGLISLLLWISIIICGRWIGFTLAPTLGS
jgi:hypothetical protein